MTAQSAGKSLPDFVIVGAMKSGTTTLYNSLQEHPDVFMPPLEIGFFDIDDLRQHPDFFKRFRGDWYYHEYEDPRIQEWYRKFFVHAEPGQVTGERSTSYMASSVAPRRLRELIPEVKLIFLLRDPVSRAFSNYWHLLRSGEATCSFEKAIRYRSNVLFDRGLYREQIERYLEFFPKSQMLFLVFEQYVAERHVVWDTVCQFLGISPEEGEVREKRHRNRGRYPWSRSMQYLSNAVLYHWLLDGQRYSDRHLPNLTYDGMGYSRLRILWTRTLSTLNTVVSRVNCSRRKRPEMAEETKRLLKYEYEVRNEGLSELIDIDLTEWWEITRA